MYLVARPYQQAIKLIELLNKEGFNAHHLPILEIQPREVNFERIGLLDDVDGVFFSSPTAIELSINLINKLSYQKVITPGVGTSVLLGNVNKNIKVFYPSNSGIDGVIEENLFLGLNKLLIVGGESINNKLLRYCNLNNLQYEYVSLYNRISMIESHIEKISCLINDNMLDCVIVTSTQIACLLKTLIKSNHLIQKKLESVKIVCIHQNIVDELHEFNFNIYKTNKPENFSIIELIRELNDDRKSK